MAAVAIGGGGMFASSRANKASAVQQPTQIESVKGNDNGNSSSEGNSANSSSAVAAQPATTEAATTKAAGGEKGEVTNKHDQGLTCNEIKNELGSDSLKQALTNPDHVADCISNWALKNGYTEQKKEFRYNVTDGGDVRKEFELQSSRGDSFIMQVTTSRIANKFTINYTSQADGSLYEDTLLYIPNADESRTIIDKHMY